MRGEKQRVSRRHNLQCRDMVSFSKSLMSFVFDKVDDNERSKFNHTDPLKSFPLLLNLRQPRAGPPLVASANAGK